MTHKFFLLTKEEAADGTKCGYSFIKNNQDRLIDVPEDEGTFIMPGFNVGNDFVIHDGKSYMVKKSFLDIENHVGIILCAESYQGCDNRKNFN